MSLLGQSVYETSRIKVNMHDNWAVTIFPMLITHIFSSPRTSNMQEIHDPCCHKYDPRNYLHIIKCDIHCTSMTNDQANNWRIHPQSTLKYCLYLSHSNMAAMVIPHMLITVIWDVKIANLPLRYRNSSPNYDCYSVKSTSLVARESY